MATNAATHTRFIVHPHKFNLWLAIVSMIMMFAAFTSAYIVKKNDLNSWMEIQLPQIFTYSTTVILASSIFMHTAYIFFKRNNIYLYRLFLCITFALGATFLILQIQGWEQLTHSGITLAGNPSGSFIYVISGAHFLHVAGGVIALLVFSVKSFTAYKTPVDTLMVNIDPDRQRGVELMTTYWHFVDILWIYLFIFFQLN